MSAHQNRYPSVYRRPDVGGGSHSVRCSVNWVFQPVNSRVPLQYH
ncbi:Uncharacterised protein [Vibrio cholerae]|nr:Uncharacterised protein [Vibrio cholerae]